MKKQDSTLTGYMKLVITDIFRMFRNGYNGDTHLPIITMLSMAVRAGYLTREQEVYFHDHFERYCDKAIDETYGRGTWRLKQRIMKHGLTVHEYMGRIEAKRY